MSGGSGARGTRRALLGVLACVPLALGFAVAGALAQEESVRAPAQLTQGTGATTGSTQPPATATTTATAPTSTATTTTPTSSATTPTTTAAATTTTTTTETPAQAAKRLCAAGAAYREAHRNDDALGVYKQALQRAPQDSCGADGVKATGGIWASWRAAFVDLIRHPLLALAIPLALLLVLGNLGWRVLSRIPRVGPRFFAPRLKLAALDDQAVERHPGPALGARVVERLQALAAEARNSQHLLDLSVDDMAQFDVVTGDPRLQTALGKAADVSEQTRAVAALLGVLTALAPRPLLEAGGVLDPPRDVAAATFTLTAGVTLNAATSVSVKAARSGPAEATDYVRVADSAAAWIQFEAARWTRRTKVCEGAAASYAAVREGIDRHLEGKDQLARAAFIRAIQLDPQNWAARVDLALTEARLTADWERAISTLRAAYRERTGEDAPE